MLGKGLRPGTDILPSCPHCAQEFSFPASGEARYEQGAVRGKVRQLPSHTEDTEGTEELRVKGNCPHAGVAEVAGNRGGKEEEWG
jgi:hypothetical protein